MDELKWEDKFSVGNYEIDRQHKRLFEFINNFNKYHELNIISAGLVTTLNDMKNYTEYHLKYEEDLLNKISYKEVAYHKKIHDQFINTINKVENDLLNMGDKEYADLGIFLTKWIYNHILIEDKKYVKYLNQKENNLC